MTCSRLLRMAFLLPVFLAHLSALALLCFPATVYAQTTGAGSIRPPVPVNTIGPGALPDLVVTFFRVTSFTVDDVSYRYTIKNAGNAPADLSRVAVQAQWANSESFHNPKPGGGAKITAQPTLPPGASLNGVFSCPNTTGLDTLGYARLLVDSEGLLPESNEKNNGHVIKVLGH